MRTRRPKIPVIRRDALQALASGITRLENTIAALDDDLSPRVARAEGRLDGLANVIAYPVTPEPRHGVHADLFDTQGWLVCICDGWNYRMEFTGAPSRVVDHLNRGFASYVRHTRTEREEQE